VTTARSATSFALAVPGVSHKAWCGFGRIRRARCGRRLPPIGSARAAAPVRGLMPGGPLSSAGALRGRPL